MIDYGDVTINNKTIHLTQQAYPDNYGTDGGVRYYAHGVDDDGVQYLVAWETTAEWDAEQAAYRANPDTFVESISEDRACDWDTPISATEV